MTTLLLATEPDSDGTVVEVYGAVEPDPEPLRGGGIPPRVVMIENAGDGDFREFYLPTDVMQASRLAQAVLTASCGEGTIVSTASFAALVPELVRELTRELPVIFQEEVVARAVAATVLHHLAQRNAGTLSHESSGGPG